jgi:hypothetical protein
MLFWILEIIWRKSLLASWRKGVKLGHAGAGGVVGGDSGYCVITLLFFDWDDTTDPVSNVGAPNPENDVFRNIGCVICNAFEIPHIPHYNQSVQSLLDHLRLLVHHADKIFPRIIVHTIHNVIHLEHGEGQICIFFDKGIQGASNHACGRRGHPANIHWQFDSHQLNLASA